MQNDQTPNENNNVDPAARSQARHYAIQAMYQWMLSGTLISVIEGEFIKRQIDRKLDLAYFKELIHGIVDCKDELDDEIKPFLNRSMQDIDPIELSVLRLAVFELKTRPEIPYRVIINEALELTKRFGSIEGYKFVNGILDRIAKKIRATEIGMEKR
jgi:N utilization substance protein B